MPPATKLEEKTPALEVFYDTDEDSDRSTSISRTKLLRSQRKNKLWIISRQVQTFLVSWLD